MAWLGDLRGGGAAPLTCERKFAGPASAAARAEAVLRARCLPDPEHPRNRIASIYFDTPSLSSLAEKENGDALKTKIRLRWYDDEAGDGTIPAFLEAKRRLCAARSKARVVADVSSGWLRQTPLDDGSFVSFLALWAPKLGLPAGAWTPVCCISYDRLRFIDPVDGSRVSLDFDIEAPRVNGARFPWASPPVRLDAAVCEFKNPGGNPPAWAHEMARAGLGFGSFSKYGELAGILAGRGA